MTRCALALVLLLSAAPASARQQPPFDPTTPAPQPPRFAPIETARELAEVLGRAHAVRTLCNGPDDAYWRNYMVELLEQEGEGGRRGDLTNAFNRGYRSQRGETSECSGNMTGLEASIARRGKALSDAIAKSYVY
jgi:uncharacterized protein (TIGR02301 family)